MTQRSRFIVLIIATMALGPSFADAQISLEVGSKVRISAPSFAGGITKGTLAGLSKDTLELRINNKTLRIERSSIKYLWRISGEKSHTFTGALIGLPAGALAGMAVTALTCDPGFEELCTRVGLLVGAGVGLIAGGIIGSRTKSERWEEVDVNKIGLNIGLIRPRTTGLSLTWSF